jgi:hypothetical protein
MSLCKRPLRPRCWRPTAVRTAFRLYGWQEDDRQAERLAQPVWCALEREEQRCYIFAQQLERV